MIKTTFFKNKELRGLTILSLFFTMLFLASSPGYAGTDENIETSIEESFTRWGRNKKEVIFKNNGDCDVDIYIITRYRCDLVKRLKAGQRWTTKVRKGTKFHIVDAYATDFNNLQYDVWYKVKRSRQQVVSLAPDYCADTCESFTVNAGEDVSICEEDEITLQAVVNGDTTCVTEPESDCNHSLYASGGYYNNYYPHSNAAYCGSGKGAKLWTKSGWGTSYVTIDFGREVPAGTKIHTRMRLEHCSNNGGNYSNAKIQASRNGNNSFTNLVQSLKFTNQQYNEYTYTLNAPARFIRVIDNGGCSFLVDYVRYEIEGTTNNTVSYEWAGPGIVGSNTESSVKVNKAGTYTVTATNCEDCEATDTVEVTFKTPLTDAGTIAETQANCGPFDPEEFIGTEADGGNAGDVVYQWQIKRIKGAEWEDIEGANDKDYIAPYIESGSLWYRRGAKREECGPFIYSNSVDLHVKEAPEAEVILTNADCVTPTGEIKFTFEDTEGRTHIEFSLDGGENYTTVTDDSGMFSFTEVEVGDYNLWVRWGNDDCPVDLGTVTIEEVESITVDAGADQSICVGEQVTINTQVTGEGKCEDCVEYTIEDTDYCRGDHNFVAWVNTASERRWYSNVDLVWRENSDGTATLKGTMYDYYYTKTNYEVDVIYSGRTTTSPEGSPKEHFCNDESTSGWEYYTAVTGTITQVGGTEVFTIARRGEAFQVGNGANVYETETAKDGASGWFDVVGGGIGDFNINFGECVDTVSNGVEYLWSTGETTESITVSPSETTTYSVTISNCEDCVATDEVTVYVNEASVDLGEDQNICSGDEVELVATAADSYLWSNGETTQSITVSPTEDTTYTVTVTQNGCEATDEIAVTVSTLSIDAGEDQDITSGQTATLSVTTSSEVESYQWSNGATTKSITVSPSETTTYTVTATKNGCAAVDNVTVNVEVDPCVSEEYVVTAFPIPVSASGVLNIDVAVNAEQDIVYETYKMDGNRIGPAVTYHVERGCNTIEVDMVKHCNFQPQTTYMLIVTGNGWSESIQFMTE
ncbi:hypothetical protein [Aquimarina sp. 2201CG5-10]|uniref:hypothetical protein n=1 Tax=Aquimarina callyspongiae TaxID=3098150 RepID=UPI002AB4F164|nr:hypothetical protein [Aquimarina sp. 2201CG5-10]MDY8138386.1 hypothetical protein [Aquimarina sp. 2201CG5-10]